MTATKTAKCKYGATLYTLHTTDLISETAESHI